MNSKEERNTEVTTGENETEEVRLKIEKLFKLQINSYEAKINSVFWAALSGLEFLIRYVSTDKSLKKLIPITIIPLAVCIFNKIRLDIKIHNTEKEILNSKQK